MSFLAKGNIIMTVMTLTAIGQRRWLLTLLLIIVIILTTIAIETKDYYDWESLRRFKNLNQNKLK